LINKLIYQFFILFKQNKIPERVKLYVVLINIHTDNTC